jgi:hypothetical protein
MLSWLWISDRNDHKPVFINFNADNIEDMTALIKPAIFF